MPSLIQTLAKTYPAITFIEGERFAWVPDAHQVTFATNEPDAEALLLHELGHSLLEHTAYSRDIELIAMERAAWDKALEVAAELGLDSIGDDFIEEHLDTYRDWLHARSTCPACTATGYQTGAQTYECPACHTVWRVNEARLCGLKRYKQ